MLFKIVYIVVYCIKVCVRVCTYFGEKFVPRNELNLTKPPCKNGITIKYIFIVKNAENLECWLGLGYSIYN